MAALEVLVDLVELAEVVVAKLGLRALEATPPLASVVVSAVAPLVLAKDGEPPCSFQSLPMTML